MSEWCEGNAPTTPGWYAVACVWDIREGICLYANYWNGTVWNDEIPVTMYNGPFPSDTEALQWAYENDPEG